MKSFGPGAYTTLFFSLMLLVFSCGDSAMLDLYGGDEVTIQSLADGSILAPGDTLPLTLSLPEGSELPESLNLSLFSGSGELLRSWALAGEFSLTALDTSGMTPGLYRLVVRPGDGYDGTVDPLDLPFFISSDPAVINGLSAYPSAAKPGEGMLFFADVDISGAGDPYIRWTASGKVIAEGRIADGTELVSWTVPDTEGVYAVLAELFPFPPGTKDDFSFLAPERFRIEAFVSADPGPVRGEFTPDSSYSTVFHFRGTRDTEGFAEISAVILEGTPGLAVESGLFGYRFAAEDAIKVTAADAVLPVVRGQSGPCTIELKGLFTGNGTIFSLLGAEDKPLAELLRTDEGFVFLLGETRLLLSLPGKLFTTPRYLALTIQPEQDHSRIYWYLDGRYRGEFSVYSAGLSGSRQTLVLGGGFSGILDEFGIYTRRADRFSGTNRQIYRFAQQDIYAKRLILAEGFDGGIPDALLLEGSSGLSGGMLPSVLSVQKGGGAGFLLPITSAAEGKVKLVFAEESGYIAVGLRSGGSNYQFKTRAPGAVLEFDWNITQAGCEISAPTGEEFFLPFRETDELPQLWISPREGTVHIDEILIIKGEVQITEQPETENSRAGV